MVPRAGAKVLGECVEVENSAPRVGHGPNHSHVVHAGDFGIRQAGFFGFLPEWLAGAATGNGKDRVPRNQVPGISAPVRDLKPRTSNEGHSKYREVKNERRATTTTTTT